MALPLLLLGLIGLGIVGFLLYNNNNNRKTESYAVLPSASASAPPTTNRVVGGGPLMPSTSALAPPTARGVLLESLENPPVFPPLPRPNPSPDLVERAFNAGNLTPEQIRAMPLVQPDDPRITFVYDYPGFTRRQDGYVQWDGQYYSSRI